MTAVTPILSVPSSAPNEKVKNAILAMIPKREVNEFAKLVPEAKSLPYMTDIYTPSSVLPYDTIGKNGVVKVEPQAYKEAKFLGMFKSVEPPKTGTISDGGEQVAKGFWAAVKRHPFVSTVATLAILGGGYWACTHKSAEDKEEPLEEAA